MAVDLTRRHLLAALGASSAWASAAPQITNSPAAREPSMRIGPDPNARWSGSGMGSLYPFIKKQQEKIQSTLAFRQRRPKDLEAWKAEARAKVFAQMLYNPEPCDPKPTTLERVDKGNYIRERVTFSTTPEIQAPAIVLIPKQAKFPAPAVVALHCHGGIYYWGKEKMIEIEGEHPLLAAHRAELYDGLSYPITLARNGYVVIAIDMFYFGERRLILDEDVAQGRNDRSAYEPVDRIIGINRRNGGAEGYFLTNILSSGFTWGGVMTWDDIRTIDYLVTRPEVDANRIACVGLSVGGYRANFLAGLDSRIKASCVVGWMTSLRDLIPGFERNSMISALVPGLLQYLDHPDVGSLTMPNPMMVVHGWRDGLFPTSSVVSACDTLKSCYEAIGKPERFTTYTFDGPHKFPAAAQQLMLEWFNRWV